MRAGRTGQVARGLVLAVGLLAGPAQAQQRQPAPGLPLPRVDFIAPSGGKAGETLEVVVTGTALDDPQGLVFSQPGIDAKALGVVEPPARRQGNNRGRGMRGQGGAVVSQKFQVTIPRDAPTGLIDLRLSNKWGVSNPRVFVVGDLPEVVEKEPNNDVGEAQRVALGTTINGAIDSPTDVDDFVFHGPKARRVLVSGLASSIDSRLLLALQLYDASGKLLATNHEYQGTDALLDVTLPDDGDYLVRAFAFTYTRGGPDYVYRLSLTTAPWIDAVFPPVVEVGKTSQVTVYGRNLPGGKPDPAATCDGCILETITAKVTAPADPRQLTTRGFVPSVSAYLDGFDFSLRNDAGASNPYLLTTSNVPVVLDRGGNDTVETAQEVTPPCTIAGRIEAKRDLDWYAFSARKGDVLVFETFGERLGAPLDLFFTVRNAQTKQMIGEFDDENPIRRNQNQPQPALFTQTNDPGAYRFVAPGDGRYELLVTSREAPSQAGPRHLYTVRITRPQSDFQLVVMPASAQFPEACVVGQGGRCEAAVFVARQDGFHGPITLKAEGLPPGVTCPPQVVGTGMTHGALVLSAADDAPSWTGTVTIQGTATIDGRQVVREARYATISWAIPPQQQGVIPISRLDRGCVLAVRDPSPFRLTAEVQELTATHGEKISIPLKLTRNWPTLKGPLQSVTLGNVPQPLSANIGMALQDSGGKATITIGPNVPPGVYSLVFHGQAQVTPPKSATPAQTANVTVVEPSSPVLLTIVPKELAKVTISPNNQNAPRGKTAEVTVRVNRLFDFAGEFRVRLDLPPGLAADEATIPAGQNEVRLTIRVDPEADPGNRANLNARLTASLLENAPTTQEAKFGLNVTR